MKLYDALCRLSNHIRFQHLPGNILVGKHRIWPKLVPKYRRHLLNRIDIELQNMKHISRACMTREEETEVAKLQKKMEEQKKKEDFFKNVVLNKRKMEDKRFDDHFKPLKDCKKWE